MNLFNLIRRKECAEVSILRRLCERPQDWKFSHYTATHTSGLVIWIGKGHEFLKHSGYSTIPFRPNWHNRRTCYRILKECALRKLESSSTKGNKE